MFPPFKAFCFFRLTWFIILVCRFRPVEKGVERWIDSFLCWGWRKCVVRRHDEAHSDKLNVLLWWSAPLFCVLPTGTLSFYEAHFRLLSWSMWMGKLRKKHLNYELKIESWMWIKWLDAGLNCLLGRDWRPGNHFVALGARRVLTTWKFIIRGRTFPWQKLIVMSQIECLLIDALSRFPLSYGSHPILIAEASININQQVLCFQHRMWIEWMWKFFLYRVEGKCKCRHTMSNALLFVFFLVIIDCSMMWAALRHLSHHRTAKK